jgi:DNA-binding transcriptional MerR regulator
MRHSRDIRYSPAELCDLLNISKSTLLRWEREGILPPVARDLSDNRNMRIYSSEAVAAIVGKVTEQLERQYKHISELHERRRKVLDDGTTMTSDDRAVASLQILLETSSIHKLLLGNMLGLSELEAYDGLLPKTIRMMVQLAEALSSPGESLYSEILLVAASQSRKLEAVNAIRHAEPNEPSA